MTHFEQNGIIVQLEACPNPSLLGISTTINLQAYPGISLAIESVLGVESEFYCRKYEACFYIGRAFNREKVGKEIADTIFRFVENT